LGKISGWLHRLIARMLANKTIEYTLPEKPNSRLQKYRITGKGRKLLKTLEKHRP
jgi:ATP-dependent DNA helicase RecG